MCVTDVLGADVDSKITQQCKFTFHNDTSTISTGGLTGIRPSSNCAINIRD